MISVLSYKKCTLLAVLISVPKVINFIVSKLRIRVQVYKLYAFMFTD